MVNFHIDKKQIIIVIIIIFNFKKSVHFFALEFIIYFCNL
jgi:hypothetical protein